MDADTIIFLTNALTLLVLGAGILFTLAKGLPLADETLRKAGTLVLTLAEPMRNLFNADKALAGALKKKGVNPEIADKLAELGADVIEMLFSAAPEKIVEAELDTKQAQAFADHYQKSGGVEK